MSSPAIPVTLAWGSAVEGQLGLGGIEENCVGLPRYNKHTGTRLIKEVACGAKHTLFLTEEGRVLSCGSNEKGQLGQEDTVTRPGPVSSLDSVKVTHISCGSVHSLALDSKGRLYSWGDGQYGQLGLGTGDTEAKFSPKLVTSLQNSMVIQMACGGNHNLVLTRDSQVYSWGLNNHSQLGLVTDKSTVRDPTLVSSLSGLPVVRLAAGRGHSVCVTRGGAVFAWGRNTFGQLGIGSNKDEATPTQMSVLDEEMVRYVSCGDEHTALLTEAGKLYTCGSSNYGQLGHNSTSNLDIPSLVQSLAEREVWQVSCGRVHTAVVLGPSGHTYTFGMGSSGQLGNGKRAPSTQPTLICLGDPPNVNPDPDLGTPVDPGDLEEQTKKKGCYRLRQVFAGGDQTFATVIIVKEDSTTSATGHTHPLATPSLPSPTLQTTPTSHEATPTPTSSPYQPLDARILRQPDMPCFLTRDLIRDSLVEGVEYNDSRMREAVRLLEIAFSNASMVNGSLILNDRRCTAKHPAADIVEALDLFTIIRLRLRPEDVESKKRLIFHIVRRLPMNELPCDINLEVLLQEKVLPSLNLKPCGVEGLRIFYILPAYMSKPARPDLILVYMQRFLDLDRERLKIILDWFYDGPVDYVILILVGLKKMLYKPSFRLKDEDSDKKDFREEIIRDQVMLKTAFRFMRILFTANFSRNEPIGHDQWHLNFLTDIVMMEEDFFDWMEKKTNQKIILCEYPFLLDARAKSKLMHCENLLKQRLAVTKAYTGNLHSLFTGKGVPDMSPDSFVLMVDRNNLVDSTVVQLIRSEEANFQKPLKIEFLGEEGEDEGGMAKEFFMLLCQKILNPDFGMFVEDEESHLMWFRDGETLFYEQLDYYTIIGILCGLAIYNSITVYLPFPLAVYKKLLDRPPSFEDFKNMFPAMGRSFQSLLDYEEEDFEENFGLNFTITRSVFGEPKTIELKDKGEHTPVTKDTRREYIYLYMRYFLVDSIQEQFKAFQNGFKRVCAGKILDFLHPCELMSMVVGKQVQNWEEFKLFTQYRNGYTSEDPAIVRFWEIFEDFSDEEKDKFLIFLTGTDRIPIHGFEKMHVIIQRMDGGEKFEKLPVAHTCFNVLDLPPYPSKELMREKLIQATQLTAGFGII